MMAKVTQRTDLGPRVRCRPLDMREPSAACALAPRSARSSRPTSCETEAFTQAARRV